MFLDGDPGSVRAGAELYRRFARHCGEAAGLIRGLDSADFQGDEADKFRDKLDDRLPRWLDVTGDAHQVVGDAVARFAGVFESDHATIHRIRGQAPGAHGAVDAAADEVNRLEGQLAVDRGTESAAVADHGRAAATAAAASATPAGPAAHGDELRALGTMNAAVAQRQRTEAALAAAWREYRRAKGVWDGLVSQAEGVRSRMREASKAAQDVIDGQKDTPFEKNPTGIKGFFADVGDWLDEHADLLKMISDVLVAVGGIVAMFPGIGTLIGGALIGVGMLMKLALTINGNMSWGEFAMSSLDAIPGLGKAAQLRKLTKLDKLSKVGRVCKNDPVDVFSGAVVDSEVDFRIDGAFPLVFERSLLTSYGAGRSFGPAWVSLFDSCVEVTDEGVVFLGPDGLGVEFDHPAGEGEVECAETAGWRLAFVDGAYRVRDVAAGVSYVFSMVGDFSSVSMPEVDDVDHDSAAWLSSETMVDASLAGRTGFSVVVGVSAVVHHSGHSYEVDYDSQSGLPVRVRHAGGAVVSVSTDPVTGRVIALAVGEVSGGAPVQVARYEYSVAGELTAVFGRGVSPLRYGYDAGGRVFSWTDRNGVTYRYVYDELGRCVGQAGTGGVFANATVYLPDTGPGARPGGRLSVMIQTATDLAVDDSVDVEERLAAVADLRLVRALESVGVSGIGVQLPGRDMVGGSAHVEAGERVFAGVDDALWRDELLGDVRCAVYRCDPDGDVWQQIEASGAITTTEHDRRCVRGEVDPAGGVSEFVLDEDGLVVGETAPDGSGVRIEYGPLGVPTRVVDASGRVSEVEADSFGNVVAVTDPAGVVTRSEFDYRASGSVLRRTVDASGAVTEFDCDAAGRPVRVIDPAGRVTSFTYDVFGNVVSVLDPEGAETVLVWSPHGELLERVHPDGSREVAEYDAEGNLVTSVDEAGGRRATRFGPMDSPVEMVDAAGGRIRLRYDTQLQVREIVNPDGLVWTFDYDRAGRLIGERDYNDAYTGYELDAAGRVRARTDALGRVTVNEYDDAGRLVAYSSQEDGRTEFRFNAVGDLVEAANPDAVVAFEYDPVTGALVGEDVNGIVTRWRPDVASRTSVRTVDIGGAVPAGGRWESAFSWDGAGLLEQVTTTVAGHSGGSRAGGVGSTLAEGLRFGYDRQGRESMRAMGARASISQRFDARDRLIEQVVSAPASAVSAESGAGESSRSVVAGRRWSYRADSYVDAVTDVVAGARRFGLDREGRLTSAAGDGAGVVERFRYTPAGVLDEVVGGRGVEGVASSPRSGPALSEQGRGVARRGTLVTRVGSDRFVYDAAGQLVARHRRRLSRKPEITRFTYTVSGQIRSVRCADGSRWRYGYDAFGRRVSKVHTSADGVVLDSVVFGWDGDDLASQTSVAHTGRAVGGGRCGVAAGAASTWVWVYHPDTSEPLEQHCRHYTPDTDAGDANSGGPGRPGVGGVAGWAQGRVDDEFCAIVSDLAMAPTELVEPSTGRVVGRAVSSVWGDTRWDGVSTPLRFAGQQFDPESGLHYNRYRYYNPGTASYTSVDPLGVAPNPASATAYVHNPHTWIDPLGLKGCPVVLRGVKDTHVYRYADKNGTHYVGITKHPGARKLQHQIIGRRNPQDFKLLTRNSGPLSRGQARGVEQTLIEHFGMSKPKYASNPFGGGQLTNRVNSISPSNPGYSGAKSFGNRWLNNNHINWMSSW